MTPPPGRSSGEICSKSWTYGWISLACFSEFQCCMNSNGVIFPWSLGALGGVTGRPTLVSFIPPFLDFPRPGFLASGARAVCLSVAVVAGCEAGGLWTVPAGDGDAAWAFWAAPACKNNTHLQRMAITHWSKNCLPQQGQFKNWAACLARADQHTRSSLIFKKKNVLSHQKQCRRDAEEKMCLKEVKRRKTSLGRKKPKPAADTAKAVWKYPWPLELVLLTATAMGRLLWDSVQHRTNKQNKPSSNPLTAAHNAVKG